VEPFARRFPLPLFSSLFLLSTLLIISLSIRWLARYGFYKKVITIQESNYQIVSVFWLLLLLFQQWKKKVRAQQDQIGLILQVIWQQTSFRGLVRLKFLQLHALCALNGSRFARILSCGELFICPNTLLWHRWSPQMHSW